MLDKIKELSQLLNESYSEKSVVTVLSDFFAEHYNSNLCNLVLNSEYTSNNKLYPLYKYSKVIGYLEFDKTTTELESFLDTTLQKSYDVNLEIKNPILKTEFSPIISFSVDELYLTKDDENLFSLSNFSSVFSLEKIFKKQLKGKEAMTVVGF